MLSCTSSQLRMNMTNSEKSNFPMGPKKLLVVDDDKSFSDLISDYFKAAGFEVAAADNLETAIKLFRRHAPRVVLLDFQMPIATGEKFLPILQSVDPRVKIIVVTGHILEEVEEKFKGLGYYAFFEKGKLSLETLREKVEEALSVP